MSLSTSGSLLMQSLSVVVNIASSLLSHSQPFVLVLYKLLESNAFRRNVFLYRVYESVSYTYWLNIVICVMWFLKITRLHSFNK